MVIIDTHSSCNAKDEERDKNSSISYRSNDSSDKENNDEKEEKTTGFFQQTFSSSHCGDCDSTLFCFCERKTSACT